MNILKTILNKIRAMMANRSYETKLKYLRKNGVSIGNRTRLNCSVNAFGSEPYLVTVGEDCLIAADTCFFTHDGGVKVLSDLGYFGEDRMDIVAPITVGNNVYIGSGAYILPGVRIGDNCIIGAAAVVTRDIPNNSVAVGIPARVIRSVDEYYENAVKKGWLYPTAKMSVEEKKAYFLALRSQNNA